MNFLVLEIVFGRSLFDSYVRLKVSIRNRRKVFCIGRNKTGTTSISHVLAEFGYIVADQRRGELLIKEYSSGDWGSIVSFAKYAEAFQDAPFSWPDTWRSLYSAYPDALYILTTREDKDWYDSLVRFHSKLFGQNGEVPRYEDLVNSEYCYTGFMWDVFKVVHNADKSHPYDKNKIMSIYRKHNQDIRKFFLNKPNFLEIDVSDDNSYLRLCNFLSVDPLRDRFPHLNKS